ncbi:MAG: ABC transporter permease [Armatimonadetes bacterium]|nr:ABC transporter permease [Armatimonadota bacterium]
MPLRTWAIARKEFIQLFRDARTLGVVILLPVVMLVLYGYAINMDVKRLRIAVLDQDRTPESRELVRTLQNSEYFRIVRYPDAPGEIDEMIERGQSQLAVVVPRGYAREIARGRRVVVQAVIDGSDSTTASIGLSYVTGALRSFSADLTLRAAARAGVTRAEALVPIDYRPRVWYNPELKSSHYIVPGLMAVILMMLSALLTSMTVVRERERGTIEQLVVSPVLPYELMLGKLIPYVAIAFVDVLFVLVVGRGLFGVPLRGSPVLLLSLSGVFLVAALGIGLLISTASGSQQSAMTVAIMVTMLPAFLLSGFVFPIWVMPPFIRAITYLIPARYYLVIVRGVFLKGVGLDALWQPALAMVAFGIVTLGLSALKFKKRL